MHYTLQRNPRAAPLSAEIPDPSEFAIEFTFDPENFSPSRENYVLCPDSQSARDLDLGDAFAPLSCRDDFSPAFVQVMRDFLRRLPTDDLLRWDALNDLNNLARGVACSPEITRLNLQFAKACCDWIEYCDYQLQHQIIPASGRNSLLKLRSMFSQLAVDCEAITETAPTAITIKPFARKAGVGVVGFSCGLRDHS